MNISCNNDIPAETLDVAEQRKAKQRAYYQNNKEDILAQGKAYRKANPDYDKARYLENKEAFKARNKAYRKANPDYDKARYLENKEDILARCKAYGESNKDIQLSLFPEIIYINDFSATPTTIIDMNLFPAFEAVSDYSVGSVNLPQIKGGDLNA